ncbi:DUF3885 domain-containing protein [Rhizobium laguerreae]|uniref:DUF3885 domain-containing protein n=1 Tax=Rhizobium laguerreae TaxID=1076926 RepID=UPI00144132C8|nr:hypothetical protein [Rhizobium laguerreae]NKM72955.1 hypothetical protein [Rhizobium laguerreae]
MSMSDSEAIEAFAREWAAFYADRKPMGWMLRQDKSLPWIRFHSLPGSKRYPEDHNEEAIVLQRARVLGKAILGGNADCWQVQCRPKEPNPPYWSVPVTGVESSTFADDEEDGGLWTAYVSSITWRRNELDATLLAIADDRSGPTLWVSRKAGKIFAPYDGGFDLFPASMHEVARLKADHEDWLSSHPDGL